MLLKIFITTIAKPHVQRLRDSEAKGTAFTDLAVLWPIMQKCSFNSSRTEHGMQTVIPITFNSEGNEFQVLLLFCRILLTTFLVIKVSLLFFY